MDNKTISFEEIALSRKELKALKESVKAPISLDSCQRLKALKLVDEIALPISGYAPRGTGNIKINDNGVNYLAYVEAVKVNRRKEHRHNWLIAIFSALSGALLSKPLWDIIDWIRIALFGTK